VTTKRVSWKVLAIGGAVLLPLLFVLGAGFFMDPHAMPSPLVEKAAPPFDLARYDTGERIAMADLSGKPVVLNFWATWCVTCRYEHPLMVQAERIYGDRVQFVGIAYQDRSDAIDAWLKKHGGSTYPTVVDVGGKTSIAYGIYAVPETFFITADGIIQYKRTGAIDGETLKRELDRLL
jgi:cytochrome c biogenesis protein CcmG/thiol:disulfide interchange protein DsbE